MAKSFTYAILEWARTKPADEAYEYVDHNGCAICQFLIETGRASKPSVSRDGWFDGTGPNHEYDERVDTAASAVDWDAPNLGRTFGLFAKRLESELA